MDSKAFMPFVACEIIIIIIIIVVFPGKAVFGVPLEVATKQTRLPDGVELPRVFREGIVHIDENCKFTLINNKDTKI